jgi:uncharacterized protein (TIGR03067 family)
MRWSFVVLGLVALGSATDLGAVPIRPPKKDAVKEEMKKLQGTWVLTALTRNGNGTPRVEEWDFKLTIKGNKYTVKVGDRITLEGTIKIDPTKKPKVFEETHTTGPQKGKSSVGIYKLAGDSLTLCLPETGKDNRPTDFVSKPGTNHELTVFKREKK